MDINGDGFPKNEKRKGSSTIESIGIITEEASRVQPSGWKLGASEKDEDIVKSIWKHIAVDRRSKSSELT